MSVPSPRRVIPFLCALLAALPAGAAVRLPHVFGSHMVLQQQKPIVVWGWADAGEKVTLTLGDQTAEATATPGGEWRVTLPARTAGDTALTLTVRGANTITLEDILIGEVWLCSGQSNMECGIGSADNADAAIAAAEHPQLRLFQAPRIFAPQPLPDLNATWQVCTPENLRKANFSAVGYFFGRDLLKALNVPIGLMHSSWGGTRIEPWTPPAGFAAVPALKDIAERVGVSTPGTEAHKAAMTQVIGQTETWLQQARKALGDAQFPPPLPTLPATLTPVKGNQDPTALYNAMLHPLVPFALRGAIWYQGESNHGEGLLYVEKTKALIGGWRQVWQDESLAFYFVQIAPYNYGAEDPSILPVFWEAQAVAAQTIPGCGMVVINDVGNINDIHPRNKLAVGQRLALQALARTYGKTGFVYSGPVFKSLATAGNQLRVTFDHAGSGLTTRDGKPVSHLEVRGAETAFVPAEGTLDGHTLIVSATAVTNPVALRYGWHKVAEPNLANKEGLPAWPFRAGNLAEPDVLPSRVPEAAGYTLVYDVDLARLGGRIEYAVDRHADIKQPFDRVAYCLELTPRDGPAQFVYASMDAFTANAGQLGIPTADTKAHFAKPVANLNVWSNVKGVVTGTSIATGNIEFWPNNYGMGNAASVAGASNDKYDWGDQPADPPVGYGCLQVHNYGAKQTLLAVNNWVAGAGADLGIGNRPTEHSDWTFAANAGSYEYKRLRVLVRLKP